MEIDTLEAKDPLLAATVELRDGTKHDFLVPLWETQLRFDAILSKKEESPEPWAWLDDVIEVLWGYGVPQEVLPKGKVESRSAVYPFFTSFQIAAKQAREELKKKLNETPN